MRLAAFALALAAFALPARADLCTPSALVSSEIWTGCDGGDAFVLRFNVSAGDAPAHVSLPIPECVNVSDVQALDCLTHCPNASQTCGSEAVGTTTERFCVDPACFNHTDGEITSIMGVLPRDKGTILNDTLSSLYFHAPAECDNCTSMTSIGCAVEADEVAVIEANLLPPCACSGGPVTTTLQTAVSADDWWDDIVTSGGIRQCADFYIYIGQSIFVGPPDDSGYGYWRFNVASLMETGSVVTSAVLNLASTIHFDVISPHVEIRVVDDTDPSDCTTSPFAPAPLASKVDWNVGTMHDVVRSHVSPDLSVIINDYLSNPGAAHCPEYLTLEMRINSSLSFGQQPKFNAYDAGFVSAASLDVTVTCPVTTTGTTGTTGTTATTGTTGTTTTTATTGTTTGVASSTGVGTTGVATTGVATTGTTGAPAPAVCPCAPADTNVTLTDGNDDWTLRKDLTNLQCAALSHFIFSPPFSPESWAFFRFDVSGVLQRESVVESAFLNLFDFDGALSGLNADILFEIAAPGFTANCTPAQLNRTVLAPSVSLVYNETGSSARPLQTPDVSALINAFLDALDPEACPEALVFRATAANGSAAFLSAQENGVNNTLQIVTTCAATTTTTGAPPEPEKKKTDSNLGLLLGLPVGLLGGLGLCAGVFFFVGSASRQQVAVRLRNGQTASVRYRRNMTVSGLMSQASFQLGANVTSLRLNPGSRALVERLPLSAAGVRAGAVLMAQSDRDTLLAKDR